MKNKTGWNVSPSKYAANTVNPIRSVIENLHLDPNPEKPMIALSIGDPTVFGNLGACDEMTDSVIQSLRCKDFNGYAPSTGFLEAREAVAKFSSTRTAPLEAKDVILTGGCSHALDLCISVLANPGQNILIPRPGFPLYRTLAEGLGIETKYYNLMPDCKWMVDLEDLEQQIDSHTAAIVVNNPSNPCGSVFTKSQLKEILEIAARNFIPIIADEIYEYFVFPGEDFYPIASLSKTVPILSCSGLTKRFMVPGWRTGWVLIHDRNDIFGNPIRKGIQSLSQRLMACNTIVQGALPTILNVTPEEFFDRSIATVQKNAEIAQGILSNVLGLRPIMPSGAMYMMVGIDMQNFPHFKHDLDFVEKLVSEQSVFCLPGMCFDYPNYFRIVLTVPEEQMIEACTRIKEFCQNHYIICMSAISNSNADMILNNVVAMPV